MSDKLSDEQIEAAKTAGFSWHPIWQCLVVRHSNGAWSEVSDKLARFAALLAASPAPAIPAVDREAIIERCAQVCEMERAAFRANEAVWNANPAMRPDDEYIADWESSACRGEEYATRIRALKAAPAIPAEPIEKNTPIDELVTSYQQDGFDFEDAARVKAAALRYAESMPDSHARALLHVLASAPAISESEDAVKDT